MKPLPISVVLCTYNRVELLQDALKSLLEQSLDKSLYELVVVDNASTDHTRDILKNYKLASIQPEIILLSEPNQGLDYARNTGWRHARGAYVAFIDDDCMATKDWLQSLWNCFEHVHPSPWSVGGPIMPVYDAPKPIWFKDSYETSAWGEQPRLLKRRESFTGCNMAFRKDILKKYGGFVGSIALLFWYSVFAVMRIRPGHYWRSWAIETLDHPAYNIGRLSGFFGVRMVFRQRNATTPCSR